MPACPNHRRKLHTVPATAQRFSLILGKSVASRFVRHTKRLFCGLSMKIQMCCVSQVRILIWLTLTCDAHTTFPFFPVRQTLSECSVDGLVPVLQGCFLLSCWPFSALRIERRLYFPMTRERSRTNVKACELIL